MLICEELQLLLTSNSGSSDSWSGDKGRTGVCGAVLIDLILAGRIALSPEQDPRVTITSPAPTGHAALDQALAALAGKNGITLSTILRRNVLRPRDTIIAGLIDAGVIGHTRSGLFNLIHRFPTLNPRPEYDLRQRLTAVLRGRRQATATDIAVLSLLQGTGLASTVLPPKAIGLNPGELARAIETLHVPGGPGDVVARAVKSAIDATAAAAAMTAAGAGAGAAVTIVTS